LDHEPPPLAEWLVQTMVARSAFADSILGDLREEYVRAADSDPRMARRLYWRRALSIGWHSIPRRFLRRRQARTGDPIMTTFGADLRFALRTLRRAPSFTIAAIIALGLGTGSAAAVFSLLRGVVLRPLPYASPAQLVTLWEVNHTKSLEHEAISPVNFGDYRALTNVFADAAAWWRPQINLADDAGEPVRVNAVETSENLFSVLGVRPMLGVGFPIHPKLWGTEHQAIISHRLWQTRFDGDRAIVGKVLHLNGANYTVVGVMPPGFSFPGETDVWQQLQWPLDQHSRSAHFMETVARVKPGVSLGTVQRELTALTARLASEHANTNKDWTARVIPLDHEVAGLFRPGLFALLGASGLLLLIACINVANLLLARAVARRREVAVRAAIGASRSRLLKLFLTESCVLAVIGGALGLGVSVGAVRALLAWTPIQIPRAADVGVDFTVLLFATAIAAGTAIAFGLVPAVLLSRAELQDALKDGARGTGIRGRRLRSGLVIAEVSLAVMLLSGAGLLVRSVEKLLDVDAGLDPTSSITVDLLLPNSGYPTWPRVAQFYASLTQSLRENPGITNAGVTNFLPLEPGWRLPYAVVGQPADPTAMPQAQMHIADEGYFSALHIRLIRGRDFTAHDDAQSTPVVIVNEALAKLIAPDGNAVGKQQVMDAVGIGPLSRRLVGSDHYEIIGVVKDLKNTSLRSAAEPAFFFTSRQFAARNMHLVVRGRGDAARLTELARDAVRAIDPALPLGAVKPMDRVLAESVDPPRFVMLLLSAFAVLALTLAAVGIYGILTFMVTNRQREIGIRLALGAEPSAMLRMIVGEGVGLTLIGCVFGIAGGVVAARALSSFLFNVRPSDPATLAGVSAVVIGTAIAACVIPGRRAAGEDPTRALRSE